MSMLPRSIKWRLQIWHGVILLLVLAGFGLTAVELQRTRELRRVDQELQDRLGALIPAFRPLLGGGRFGERVRPPRRPPPEGERPQNLPREKGERPDRADRPERPDRTEGPPEAQFAAPGESDGYYYALWSREGRLLRAKDAPDDLPAPGVQGQGQARTRGELRELIRFTPRGDAVLVGRSIAPEIAEMRTARVATLGTGFAILALGLAGGWLVATRAMRPIEAISRTAVKIASGDLSQRITAEEAESELGRLASILNSTFGRLEAAFNEQARFTTDVSHELRTPVAVIVSQTQATLARERSAGEYREALEACHRAAQRMRGLIESLMQLARLDAGQESLHKAEFDLGQAARDCAELLQPLAEERGLALKCGAGAVRCQGDAAKIGQVLANLATNAIHYTPRGGEVALEARAENGFAVCAVRDTGIGIPPDDLPRIFDRFYRVEASRSREKGGSGLGLAISRAIAHAHGGTLEASSEPGRGTVFTLRLPVV